NIVKTDKFHIKGRPAECFDDPCIGIILFIVNGVMDHMISPGPHLSPAVKDSHLFDAVWRSAFDVLIQGSELVADLFYISNKLRELHGQFQISSISDPVNRLSQDGSSRSYPVHFGLLHRVSSLMEDIREDIGQEPSFAVTHSFDITQQPQCRAISYASHYSIKSDSLNLLHNRLCTDPVVPNEHHGFFSAFMGDVHHLFRQFRNLSALECLEITKFL